ncbi:hypothetical protein MA16_Dca000293 [Dendrobium catenatum]|uniref:Uncharacterized protein n=1 Tax=Dendrobium catenatum TaxID=906689 RepID=A0A2I0WTG0_9ASPA|nr:hypothetical protein MA16_Dca000293 [Dendrobium catenatum]
MDGSFSSAYGVLGKTDEPVDENLKLYSLKVGNIVEKAFSNGDGKHRRRKF